MPELKAMRAGRVPWVGLTVNIIAGHFKGQRAIVRDVNHYTLDPRRPRKRSGLTISLERLVIGLTVNNLVQLDYDEVTFSR
jgi:transcription elongation factor